MSKLVTLEGIEGTGKSTLWDGLKSHLSAAFFKEPGGTIVGDFVNDYVNRFQEKISPTAQLLLFEAARSCIMGYVKCALESCDVVMDRHTASTQVYQGLLGEIPLSTIQQLNDLATDRIKPDIKILLVASPVVAYERCRKRDRLSVNYLHKAQNAFLDIAAQEGDWHIIDGEVEPDYVLKQALEIIEQEDNEYYQREHEQPHSWKWKMLRRMNDDLKGLPRLRTWANLKKLEEDNLAKFGNVFGIKRDS